MCHPSHAQVTESDRAFGLHGARIRRQICAMTVILQNALSYNPTAAAKLPGMAPLDPADWIIVDDAFGPQMALRAQLLATKRDAVTALDPAARPAAAELLARICAALDARPDYTVARDHVIRPDGQRVPLDHADPMGTLGHLVQQDLCLLEKQGDEHVLTGAVLCFPASWTLHQKFMRPLIRIHLPVVSYDDMLARRVQRLFDGIKPDLPLWRFNALWYADPALHQPRQESDQRRHTQATDPQYLRTERQSLMRLPQTGAVVFGIHTSVMARQRVQMLWPATAP